MHRVTSAYFLFRLWIWRENRLANPDYYFTGIMTILVLLHLRGLTTHWNETFENRSTTIFFFPYSFLSFIHYFSFSSILSFFFLSFHHFFRSSFSFLHFFVLPPFVFLVTVNNAGFGFFGPLEAMSMEKAKSMFDTNYFGTVRLIRAALPIMKKQKSGRILNISSILGHLGECE